jgi:hypothetical protein
MHPNKYPHVVLDELKKHFLAKTDTHLAEVLGCSRTHLSQIRSRKRSFNDAFMLVTHIETNWQFDHIRMLRDRADRQWEELKEHEQ